MKTLPIPSLALGVCLVALSAGVAFAGKTLQMPTTGQPGTSNGVNCLLSGPTPGHSATSQAPFNEPASVMGPFGSGTGSGGNSGMHFAGQPLSGSLHANSTAAVSQYDIACLNQLH
jgi:hypothetical protein